MEALIDIQCELEPSYPFSTLKQLEALVIDRYPIVKDRYLAEGRLDLGPELGATASRKQIGYSFTSAEGRHVLQARLDGFTFSRLKPYLNWPQLRDECKNLWALYKELAKPTRVNRIAVRYINQIDIPLGAIDYKDYFLTTPEIAQTLPQDLSGFFMKLQIPCPDFGGGLILTQMATQPAQPGWHSVVLDIDVFKQCDPELAEPEMWDTIEMLKATENKFFFESITERTQGLFGPRKEY